MLQNEKYCGDTLMQKTYTVDFLSKKKVKNHGEVDQYFMEDSHEAIIPKDEWQAVQMEFERRDVYKEEIGLYAFGNDSSPFSGRLAIVTDEAAVLQDKSMYKTARAVKWLAKNIDEDITDINNGKLLHRMTFAKVPNMNVKDVIKLAEKVNPGLESTVIEENTEPHVFIIDEINRGNISKIFGELITLIESTKRAGMSESASAILPYSGDEFSVPSNVYILGTMNTADRSIALMDTALRRRFQFIEMMPDSDVLRKIHADKVEDLDVAAVLDKINERITFLYDREHTIGHAFFTGLKDDASLAKLQSIFEKSVIPLLQEYFYEDYQKIQFVLGDNAKSDDSLKFILDEKVVAKNIFKGNVEDVIDLPEKRYSINKVAFSNINSYKEIL